MKGSVCSKRRKRKSKGTFYDLFFWHFPLSRDCFSWLPVTVAFVSWLVSIFSQICSLQCSLSCLLRIKHSKIHIRSSLVSSTVLAGQEFKLLLIRVAPRYTFLLVPSFDKLNLLKLMLFLSFYLVTMDWIAVIPLAIYPWGLQCYLRYFLEKHHHRRWSVKLVCQSQQIQLVCQTQVGQLVCQTQLGQLVCQTQLTIRFKVYPTLSSDELVNFNQ